jgi:hypothetical protein
VTPSLIGLPPALHLLIDESAVLVERKRRMIKQSKHAKGIK